MHVGLKREELRKIKSRLNALVHSEREKIRELNDNLLNAKQTLKRAEVQKKKVSSKYWSDRSGEEEELNRYRVHRMRFNTNDSLMEAKQSVADKNRRAYSYAKDTQKEQNYKFQRQEAERRIKNMQTIIKTKMYELAAVQNSKNQMLVRKLDNSKRLTKEKKQKKEQLTKANFLMNYSLDIENMIKSNIEMAMQLKAHYEALLQAGSFNASELNDPIEEDSQAEELLTYGQLDPLDINLNQTTGGASKRGIMKEKTATKMPPINRPQAKKLVKIHADDSPATNFDIFERSMQPKSQQKAERKTNGFTVTSPVPESISDIKETEANDPPDDIFAMAVKGKSNTAK